MSALLMDVAADPIDLAWEAWYTTSKREAAAYEAHLADRLDDAKYRAYMAARGERQRAYRAWEAAQDGKQLCAHGLTGYPDCPECWDECQRDLAADHAIDEAMGK